MLKTTTALVLSAALLSFSAAQAAEDFHAHHGANHQSIYAYAPHSHGEGEWMATYKYGRMGMKGNIDGNDDVSTTSVLSNFMVAPTEMTMDMHMFGLMYGATDDLTIMTMVPYVNKSMTHVTRMGQQFTTRSKGLGDTKVTGLYTVLDDVNEQQKIVLKAGVSLPTGSINKQDTTPMGFGDLPYPMQLGSGTFDPILGVTYSKENNGWAYGASADGTLRFGKNNEGYRLGHEFAADAWVAKEIAEFASVSFALKGKRWGDIEGADTSLNPMVVPTARTDLRSGKRIDAVIGANLYQQQGEFNKHTLELEFGLPVYQDLDGPQLETDYTLAAAWKITF